MDAMTHDDDSKSNTRESVLTRPRQRRCGGDASTPEANPHKSLTYLLFTVQFMVITLDLFMESSEEPAGHYAMTALEFVTALYLSTHQAVRIRYGRKKGYLRFCGGDRASAKASTLLAASACLQLYFLALACFWFDIANDRDTTYLEWSFFALSIVWGLVNSATFPSVEAAAIAARQREEEKDEDDGEAKGVVERKQKKKRISPVGAAANVFSKHLSRTPYLLAFGALFACAQAILTTYQGAIINDLTKAVTKRDKKTGELTATFNDVERMSGTLIGVWLAANVARFVFDVVSAVMFSKLERWLRGAVFERAVEVSSGAAAAGKVEGEGGASSLSPADIAAEYQARYASDVTGVVSLYSTILRGVIVNVLLIITNFVFLVLYEWRVATVTLGFLAMGVTSGPTDLAGEAASDVQRGATSGLSELSDAVKNADTVRTTPGLDRRLVDKHEADVLVSLQRSLRRQIFFSNAVDTYMHFFSSFLTVVVVITMSFEVFADRMDSSEFLGIFFVFKQLQKPAMKISGVLKSAVKRSANLQRLNEAIFPEEDGGGKGVGDGDTVGEGCVGVERAVSSGAETSASSTITDSKRVVALGNVAGGSVSKLSLSLSRGECVLVSGSRREDVAGILSGTTTVTTGRVVVDGKVLRSRSDVVAVAATVFSAPTLLGGTVRWNVIAASSSPADDDNDDDVAVIAALRRAGISDADVAALPGGIDVDVSAARDAGWSDALLLRLAVARNLRRSPAPRVWVLPGFGVGGRLERAEWEGLVDLIRGVAEEDGAAVVISTADSSLGSQADRVIHVEEDGVVECV